VTTTPTPDTQRFGGLAKRGLRLMLGRQVVVQMLTFAGGIVLARHLTPFEFGVFGIATFFVHTLALFGDFGLAPSLIQRKAELTDRDLQVAFTMQQALLGLVAVALWVAAPWFASIDPGFGGEAVVWLIRMMALTLFLQSWRSMSVLQMERHLDFSKVAVIEVVESLSYQAIAVTLAVLGFGVWSLVWATLAYGTLGAGLAYVCRPWPVRLAFDRVKAWELLRYGLPFQAGELMNRANSWVVPLFVGSLMGPTAVGFLTWAGSNGRKPLMLMHSIYRVAFPHFSRLQSQPGALSGSFEKYLYLVAMPAGLWLAGAAALATTGVPLVYSEVWAPASVLLIGFAAAMLVDVFDILAGGAMRATGRVMWSTGITAGRSVVMMVLAVALVFRVDELGVPLAMLGASALAVGVRVGMIPAPVTGVTVVTVGRTGLCVVVSAAAGWAVAGGLSAWPVWALVAGVPTVVLTYGVVALAVAPRWAREMLERRLPMPGWFALGWPWTKKGLVG